MDQGRLLSLDRLLKPLTLNGMLADRHHLGGDNESGTLNRRSDRRGLCGLDHIPPLRIESRLKQSLQVRVFADAGGELGYEPSLHIFELLPRR